MRRNFVVLIVGWWSSVNFRILQFQEIVILPPQRVNENFKGGGGGVAKEKVFKEKYGP